MSEFRHANSSIGTLYEPPEGLYIHVPFCVQRCAYCDFKTAACDPDDSALDAYLERMVLDIRRRSKTDDFARIQTIYVGGGTPSHLGLSRLSMLFYTLSLSLRLEPDVECTMEANPESLTASMVRDIWALGVNRLSLGVQSLNDDILKCLGRVHSSEDAREAIRIARERFENISVDLMCGIPGQTDEMLRESIEEVLRLGVTHLSIYPLTIEERTPLHEWVSQGTFEEPDDDVAARHMKIAETVLISAGFERYEVANYALPGFESKHNTSYWTGKSYLGLGRGAASCLQSDARRIRLLEHERYTEITEDLTLPQMMAEDMMLAMRRSKGVAFRQVEEACRILPQLSKIFTQLEADGLVSKNDGYYQPTERGWLCGNELFGSLLAAAD